MTLARQLARRTRLGLLAPMTAALGGLVGAQGSLHALRFHGTGSAQADRVRIAIDDDASGPDASAPCDLGDGGFTVEFWMRGRLAENDTLNGGGDQSFADDRWRSGNVVVDRDILGGSERDFGVSIAGGFVRFGTGGGDGPGATAANTLEGNVNVLDDLWHHVAVVREAQQWRKQIFVDGVLDVTSPANTSTADLSYPNDGVPGQGSPHGPFLVLGAEKHDEGAGHPSFDGFLDELRLWDIGRRSTEIATDLGRILAPGTLHLVASYRFEEGGGASVADTSAAGSPTGILAAGVPGNGEWVAWNVNPRNCAPIQIGSLPPGFQRDFVAAGFVEPNALCALPDGRMLVGDRVGRVFVVGPAGLLPTPLLTLAPDTQFGERGLVGLVCDPYFALNRWIYAYWTTPEPRNCVSRFTVIGDTASLASEFVVWENPALAAQFHHGGGLVFGPEGDLYIATGDQFNGANSRSLSNEHGKLLRVHPNGTIPIDNPFIGVAGARPAIFARGLRNPFRITFEPQHDRVWIGDVGGNSSASYEELDRAVAGADYGWPEQEGGSCYVADCSGFVASEWSYRHDDPAYATVSGSGCIVAGTVVNGGPFPLEYQGNLILGDYANRWIRRLVVNAAGHVTAEHLFDPAPGPGTLADLEMGADGALYYLTWGVPGSGPAESSKLWRIRWIGTSNLPPIAVASASQLSGSAPLAVQFDSAGSFDPDQGPSALSMSWNFGDGTGSTLFSPLHTYTSPGTYTAIATASDGSATTSASALAITVGGVPDPVILTPLAHTTYRAGQTIHFSGTATDPEDGVLPPSGLTWRILLAHEEHEHPFLGPLTGITAGQFTVPSSGHTPEDTHYEVVLEARDSSGNTATTVRDLEPITHPVRITSAPNGVSIRVDGEPRVTPVATPSLEGFRHELTAPRLFVLGGLALGFQRWSNGIDRPTCSWTVPPGGGEIRALYRALDAAQLVELVPAANANAEFSLANGQSFAGTYDNLALCFGRETAGSIDLGLEFELDVPRGADILEARLEFTATADQLGAPRVVLRAYRVGNAPPFVQGSMVSLLAHATLHAGFVSWTPPPFLAGQTYTSPDLALFVDAIVKRPNWNGGQRVGFVLDASTTTSIAHRCVRNFASGTPPRLVVRYTWTADDTGRLGAGH